MAKRVDQPMPGRYELRQTRLVSVQAEIVALPPVDDDGRVADRAPVLELRIAGEAPTTDPRRVLELWPYLYEVDEARWRLLAREDPDGLPDAPAARPEHALIAAERMAELRQWLNVYATVHGGLPKPTNNSIVTGIRAGKAHVVRRRR